MIIEFHDMKWSLPMIAQYESYEYAAGLCCPNCGEKYGNHWSDNNTEGIVGFCETEQGEYQICLECPECHTKYRYHYAKFWNADATFNVEKWKKEIGLVLFLDHGKNKEYDKFLVYTK